MVGGEWLAGDRAVMLPPSPPRPRSPSFVATRRKSLRLTGSHGITGTRDIYASAPTDRSITRNKEIANLLQESSTTALRFLGTLSAHPSSLSHIPSSLLLLPLLRYCPPSTVEGGPPGPRVISAFMGRDRHGSSGNIPDDGEKSCDESGCSERGRAKLIIRALLATA